MKTVGAAGAGRESVRSRDEGSAPRARLLGDAPIDERRLEIAGAPTSLLTGGHGHPLVLLHGGIQVGGVIWWRVIRRLANSHRLVIPDIPGLGESDAGVRRLDAAGVAEWLGELIRVTCDAQPTLVAHSVPGAWAARFAAEHDGLLRRLVLVDAVGLGRSRPPLAFLAAVVQNTVRPTPATFDRLMRHSMRGSNRERDRVSDDWEAFKSYFVSRAVRRDVKKAMRQVGRAASTTIPETKLRTIPVPTTLIWGSHDRVVPRRVAEAASDRFAWPLRVIDDAGHLPHVERPDAFVDALGAAVTDE